MKPTNPLPGYYPMKRSIVVLAAAVALAGCTQDLSVPNLNAPSAGGAVTRSTVVADAQGLIAFMRGLAEQGVRYQGVWGRESYDLRPQEPRTYTDYLIGPRDPNSFATNTYFGGNYTTIVNARTLIDAVKGVTDMTDPEREAVRGWAQLVEAYAYSQIAINHPGWGAPLEPPADPTGALVPVATQADLYARSVALFDSAATHLQAGGSAFPFSFTAGFSDFASPAGLLKVDRALEARTLKYMGSWAQALTALQGSFVDATQPTTAGAFFDHGTSDGQSGTNPFYNVPTDYVHPRIRAEAQSQPNGSPDERVLEKLKAIASVTLYGITVSDVPVIYNSPTSQFPLIKNEELLLIRAEAELATGNASAALQDVNAVRVGSGHLAPLPASAAGPGLLDEILYEKRYSLLWEGGFTYLDALQYGRLAQLPRAQPTNVVFDKMNWPANECLARALTTGPCGSLAGQ